MEEIEVLKAQVDRLKDFERLVREMRAWQRLYFQTRTKYHLGKAKEWEKKIDEWYLSEEKQISLF